MTGNIVHVLHKGGHREAFLKLFSSVFDFSSVTELISIKNIHLFLRAERVLFATVGLDKSFKWFFIISLIRAILMKPTCAILVISSKDFDVLQSNRVSIMKLYLRLWKHLYKQTTLSIIPYHLDKRLSNYTKNCIYDPQMWDMYCIEYRNQLDLDVAYAKRQVEHNNKPLVVFLGKFTHRKGLKEFVRFVEINRNDFQFIVAGKIPTENIEYIEHLKALGVKVINEFLEESKLLGFYKVADFTWCYYLPIYDQTSGVFGRAIQFGVIPIVRLDSMISYIAKKENIPCVELNFESENNLINMSGFSVKEDSSRDNYFVTIRDDALNKLKAYLYL
jgi:hypothetical protein